MHETTVADALWRFLNDNGEAFTEYLEDEDPNLASAQFEATSGLLTGRIRVGAQWFTITVRAAEPPSE